MHLNEGNNSLVLRAKYKDKMGRTYSLKKEIIIELGAVNFLKKIMILMNNLDKFIKGIFT